MIHEFRNGDRVLEIFQNFQIDNTLPKHKKVKTSNNGFIFNDTIILQDSSSMVFGDIDMFGIEASSNKEAGVKKKSLYDWIRGLFVNTTKKKTEVKLPPDIIFKLAKEGCKALEIAGNRIAKYNKLIDDAKANGQVALSQKLEANKNLTILESELYSVGDIKFLEESDVIEFAEQCMKGLRLDWMKNFIRIIPADIAKKKLEMDKYGIFDNYVILHYDPEGKSTQLTKEEIEHKRDPILFGVIKGSRRLYFIGDWIDDYCDLTLDEVAELVPVSELTEDPTKVERKQLKVEVVSEL